MIDAFPYVTLQQFSIVSRKVFIQRGLRIYPC